MILITPQNSGTTCQKGLSIYKNLSTIFFIYVFKADGCFNLFTILCSLYFILSLLCKCSYLLTVLPVLAFIILALLSCFNDIIPFIYFIKNVVIIGFYV